jgi:hypothetical protein
VSIGLALAALVATIVLAACGSGIEQPPAAAASAGSGNEVKVEAKPSGSMTISNWPLYIDKKTVGDFEKETGVSVKYVEDVNSNEEFFAKLQPLLAEGKSGERSLFVVTDWMAKKMHELGYLQEFEPAAIPNFEKNLADNLRGASYDPGRDFAAPWQSGMTGIIVNKEKAPDVHSICDLFDPKYKGKVDMLNELRDTVPLVMEVRRRRRRTRHRSRLAESDRKNQGGGRIGADPALHRQRLRLRPDQRRRGGGDRLVGRRCAVAGRQPEHRMADARRRLHPLVGQHGDPGRGAEPDRRRGLDQLRLRPGPPGPDRGVRQLRQPGRRDQRSPAQGRTGSRQQQTDLPAGVVHEEVFDPALAEPRRRTEHQPSVQRGAERLSRWRR